MKIYLVNGIDELYGSPSPDCRTIKAFKDRDKAQDFLADCGFAYEQWDKASPKEVDNDDVNAENWHNHCSKHPFYSEDDGHMPTAFELVEVEFEE